MASSTHSNTLPVLPLPGDVLVPGMVVTISLESDEANAAAQAAQDSDQTLLLVPRIGSSYAKVGVVAKVESAGQLPGGTRALVVRAVTRARVGSGVVGTGAGLWVTAEPIEDDEATITDEARRLGVELRATLRALFEHLGTRQVNGILSSVAGDDPGALADLVGWWPELSTERKVELLETVDVEARVRLVLEWAKEALAERELATKIAEDVREGLEEQQREHLLRRQMDAIRKELGDDADAGETVDDYRQRIDALEVGGVDATVVQQLRKELGKYERMSEQQTERGWIQGWLDVVLALPWTERSDDQLDVQVARATLDADHTGLDEVKERIVELLAVRKLRAERGIDDVGTSRRKPGAILALVGPPGVGKTSLGESIARSLGRTFVRVALGGVRDEAEIRGHRRTYVGAQPGRIVRALTEAGTMNPVILLDEVDKVGSDWRGDPSAALLEVLDPAQNHTFRDNYVEVDLDLSDVLFIATANVLETVPGPLLDRLEIIQVDGYTDDEKVAIARDHLLARQVRSNGLEADEIQVSEAALRGIVAGYTREAGVRELERQLGKALRKVAVRVAGGATTPVPVDAADLVGLLGRQRFHSEEIAERTAVPGVATGLAVTGAGGDVLFVEATSMDGETGLQVTGQLGDVMQESAQIALSWVRSHRDAVVDGGIAAEELARRFHVHFPAGAVPKDGPSAGITMTTALVSLLTGRPVRREVAMTGEVTLSGRVLPIGGVKQKVLAAHRFGVTEVILPARNGPDLDDLPDAVREAMTVHLVSDVSEVLGIALEPAA
ncbi:MAG: endopeptidase La [Acidimicrobiales bacterium]|nr:endopeptidase La [Acidimicrobiales bacterium]